MSILTSADGTVIDYESSGKGPTVVFVAGAVQHRLIDPDTTTAARSLAEAGYTAVVYDRRGRGGSGDTPPWSLEREVEDVAALIAAVGATATLYSSSSGAAVAMAAALMNVAVTGLVLYEPPFFHGADKTDQIQAVAQLIDQQDHAGAMRYNLTEVVGLPVHIVNGIATGPSWPAMCSVAPTVVYDLTALSAINTDPDWRSRWAGITLPVTVVSGSASFPGLAAVADQVAAAIPTAQRRTLEGQGHNPTPAAMVDAVLQHLTGAGRPDRRASESAAE